MHLNLIFKFIQVITIAMLLAGCSSFTCDELSDENKISIKIDLSTVKRMIIKAFIQ
jgi:hypothetical protein